MSLFCNGICGLTRTPLDYLIADSLSANHLMKTTTYGAFSSQSPF